MVAVGKPQETLLVVEDNDVARKWLGVVLRGEGYRVVPARDGQEALNLLRADSRPDLILLDMLMPVLDGWQFLGRLRQEKPEWPVPIIIMTGTILTREWAEANGCQGFLGKPLKAEPLLEEIRRCLA
jgi:two-component system chemotaxis response regulator CheY